MFRVINISEGGFLVIVKENASMILFNIGSAYGLLLLFIRIKIKITTESSLWMEIFILKIIFKISKNWIRQYAKLSLAGVLIFFNNEYPPSRDKFDIIFVFSWVWTFYWGSAC